MSERDFVDRTANLKDIENGIRNKFRWQWLEEKDCKPEQLDLHSQTVLLNHYANVFKLKYWGKPSCKI